jgi:uncharacterized repeat protein (TIGR03803 family)
MCIRIWAGLVALLSAVSLTPVCAQTYSLLKEFTGGDGQGPVGPLILSGSTFYGNTYLGGDFNCGTIFTIKTDGSGFNVLRHFGALSDANGSLPTGNLILFGNVLFGTTEAGGLGSGTVFRMNTDGTNYTVIRPFGIGAENSVRPRAGLVVVGNTLFGTTYGKSDPSGWGTVFRVATNGGNFMALMDFYAFMPPGGGHNPYTSLTVSGTNLFGTTVAGGSGNGTIFRTSTNGLGFATIKQFTGTDGASPRTPLLLAGNVLYGMTLGGGASSNGTIYKLNTNGMGYTVLKHFSGSDGAQPLGNLLLVSNYLYGTTYSGGLFGQGVLFRIHTNGSNFSVIKEFTGLDGANPSGGLVRSGDRLYGATYFGGASDSGVIFVLNLAPVVSITSDGSIVELSWPAAAGLEYQVQYKTSLDQSVWSDLGGSIIADSSTASVTDPVGPDARRLYRVLLLH